jgi:hypothetical protein
MMMSGLYILDGHRAVPCRDLRRWALWFAHTEERMVAITEMPGIMVHTLFLGMDAMTSLADRAPLLFETIIVGGAHDGTRRRYATWEQAEQGHADMVALASAG